MALTTTDLQDLLHLLETDPRSLTQLRTLLAMDELLALPARFDRLTEIVEQLAQAQQRTEERLERLEASVQALAEAQQRTEERLEQLTQAQQRTEERLEQLAQAQQRTEERLERLEATVQALAEAQQRTEERLEQLAQAQQRTEERLQELIEEVRRLTTWQRGEEGRREGERYERLISRRAPALFNGGQGGVPDQPFVQQRLMDILRALPALDVLTDDENPFLADLIWWKDEQFVVVETSLRVNGNDVIRAARRAEALRRAKAQARGVVIGEEWLALDTRDQAEARGVDWKVGDDLSEGLLAFRRVAA